MGPSRHASSHLRAEGQAPGDVGVRRLSVDGRDLPHAPRPATRPRPADRRRHPRARRRRRHRQRLDPGRRAPRDRHRLRPHARAARGRPRADVAAAGVGRGGRRGAAFEDESFDVVMSAIGVMFAPHHADAADELVRVCAVGGTLGLLSWTPDGMLGALFRTMAPFAAPPPPGASPAPLWGSEAHIRDLFGGRVEWRSLTRDVLDITAFPRATDYGEFFKARYGPTIGI